MFDVYLFNNLFLKIMKKQSFFVLILLLLGVGSAFAQKTIKGTISSDGVTLPGTNIQVKEAPKVVAISDANGNFTINVPENGKTLVFSFIGMKTKEVAIGNTTNFNIKMEPTVQQMKEVTITAVGIPREKKSLGYASQVVKSDEIGGSHEMNTITALQGKVAGLNISNSSGAVGSSEKIVLRGATSFTGNNSPLFVINGVPVDNDFRASRTGSPNYGNPISDINPDDIESINVLKGPVAAALYGSKAMNGAIIIATKKGTGEKGKNSDFLVTYNTGYSFDHVLRLPEFQNSYGQGYEGDDPSDGTENYMAADESWGAPLDGRSYIDFMGKPAKWVPQPNNIKDFFVTGHQFENGISVASGDDKGSMRLSLSSFNQKGTVPNTGFDKYTAGLNIDRKLTSKLNTEIGLNYTLSEGLNRPGVGYDTYNPLQSLFGWFGRQVDMHELKDNYNSIDPSTGLQYNWNTRYHNNPYWTLYNNLNRDRRDRIISNVKLNYKLSDWLSASVRGGSDFYVESRFQQFKKGTIDYSYMRTGGFYDDPTKQNTANLDAMLIANKKTENDFSITGTLGYSFFRNTFQSSNTEVRGLIVPDIYNVSYAATPPIVTTNKTAKEIASVYGLATLGYKDYLYLDVTGRNDWSSTLPSSNRSYFYPSVSGSFIFSELMKNEKWLSFGKLRAGYAYIGNDTDPYALNSYKQKQEIGTDPSIINNPFNGAVYLTQEDILRNDKLKPETGKSFELGTDVRFLDSRLGLDVTYYNTTTKNIIVPVSLPASSGYTSTVINAGKINNQGVEIMLNAVPVKTEGGFIWNVNFNYSKNKGKILEIANGLDKILLDADWADLYLVKGQSYGTLYGHGVLTDDKGNLLVDADGHLIPDPNPQVLGNITPNFRIGLENSFTFKNFTLGFLIDWQDGGKVFSQTNMWMDYSGLSKRTENRPDGGLVNQGMVAVANSNGDYVSTGVANTKAIDPEAYWEEYAWENWKNYTYDASFVKLRQIDISYSLPESALKKTPFSKLEIGIYARNLWLIYSKMPYVDPEVNSANSRNASGFESNAVPSSRSIGFRLKLVF
jgi:TonB-linked SusC/RagA family outer membrane protein